ncbi:uncharacterized protein [Palaemon carinicauda]|uniref:uncharacterized protein n=1 Tax=Palaemon carinicauda TaxID=392227 RepID=UPI0035B593D0
MVRNYKKVVKPYNEETIKIALQEVAESASIRATYRKYKMSTTLLKKHKVIMEGNQPTTDNRGKPTALSLELEEKIADMVHRMEKMGMGPTPSEFCDIIKDFLQANRIDVPFKDGIPGYEWASLFMKRHCLSHKKGGMMQLQGSTVAKKSVTSDPFVIQ